MQPLTARPALVRVLALAALVALVALSACGAPLPGAGPGASISGDSPGQNPAGAGAARPVACTSVASTRGVFASPEPGTRVTLAQIAQVAGYPVSDAQPDARSPVSFRGYESCQYGFATPTLGATETIYLVVGTNPLDGRTAADEFTATESSQLPLSGRNCTGNGCSYRFASFPGLGDAGLKGFNGGREVLALRRGRIYLEIGPGTLKEARMVDLAQLIISMVQ
ncbi:MAG: hypothetical protein NVSMB32_16660 [Actinomycetota bacterium]